MNARWVEKRLFIKVKMFGSLHFRWAPTYSEFNRPQLGC